MFQGCFAGYQTAVGLSFVGLALRVAVWRLLRCLAGGSLATAALLRLGRFCDRSVARHGQESFTPLRALAMRVPVYFLMQAPLLPG